MAMAMDTCKHKWKEISSIVPFDEWGMDGCYIGNTHEIDQCESCNEYRLLKGDCSSCPVDVDNECRYTEKLFNGLDDIKTHLDKLDERIHLKLIEGLQKN